MPQTGLFGPHKFTQENINLHVATKGIGVYALDKTKDANFKVSYVGRSDDDLPGRIADHLDEGYQHFKYGYFKTTLAAFERECRIYHDFEPPDNIIHPDAPDGTNYTCPVAGCARARRK
jgi:hypothetical protein